MQQSGRKNPRLQEKLDAIQREISRMESEIKGISRAVETPDSIEALRRLKQVPGLASPVTPVIKPAASDLSGTSLAEDVSVRYSSPGMPDRLRPCLPDESASLQIHKPIPDQRFNTYFGTGSLHSVRPLRQERRVQRNKAIFMLIVAGLLIVLVLKLIF